LVQGGSQRLTTDCVTLIRLSLPRQVFCLVEWQLVGLWEVMVIMLFMVWTSCTQVRSSCCLLCVGNVAL